MYYVCPSCQTELTSSENTEETVDLTCPECGCVIDVEGDETLAYSQEDKPRLKHFELLDPVGRGAYGLVWRARDTQLDRVVAIKMPTRDELEPREAKRFLQEAQSAAQLRHPNIVSVHETGIEEGRPYIVSDFIEGVTLSSFLTARSLSMREAAELCVAISRAVHYGHERGVIHRDLKPSNILIDERMQPFVTDFGLAKRISADATIAAHISVLGTPSYMAPEQARGESHYVDQRCDVYSLGVILFLLLTREKPFRGNTQMVLHQVIHDDPPSPRKLNGKVPRDLETICLKCLEKTPKRRYESAGALADDLQRYLDGKPIEARPVSLPERGWRWCQRRPAVASLLISLFLSLTIGLAGVTHYWLEAAGNAREAAANAAETRKSLYRARMNLIANYYDSGDVAGVQQALGVYGAQSPWGDMRGFEWGYFDRLTAPFHQVGNQGNVVVDVAVSRDGAMCAACSVDRQVHVWNTRTGELIRLLKLEVGRIRSVAFSPVSDLLATASSDGMIRIWDPLRNDTAIHTERHGGQPRIVRFSPDGELLLSAGEMGAIQIWVVNDLSPLDRLPSGMGRTMDAQFLPGEGERIAIAKEEGLIRIWDVRAHRQYNPIPVPSDIRAMACSGDGRTIATGSYSGAVQIVPLEGEGNVLQHATLWGRIDDVVFLPGSELAAFASHDCGLHIFDVNGMREIHEFRTHALATGALNCSPDGQSVAIGGGNGAVQVVAANELVTPAIYWHDADVRDLAWLSQGARLVAASSDGELRVWNVATGEFDLLPAADVLSAESAADEDSAADEEPAGDEEPAEDEDDLKGVVISAQRDGRLIAAGSGGPSMTLWDGDTLEIVQQISVAGGVSDVEFSKSGRLLGVAARQGSVLVYTVETRAEPLFEIETEFRVNALSFSTDDRLLAVAREDGEIQLFDVESHSQEGNSMRVAQTPFAMTFCEDNRALAVGTEAGEIQLFEVESQTSRMRIKGPSSRVSALAVLPDGTTLVSGGRDRRLRLWDTVSAELITTLAGHNRQIFGVAVAPDGETIASGGLEGDIRLWRGGPHP